MSGLIGRLDSGAEPRSTEPEQQSNPTRRVLLLLTQTRCGSHSGALAV